MSRTLAYCSASRAALVAGFFVAALAAVLFVGCGQPARQPGSLRVVVSIQPLLGLARALAPDGADVSALIAVGQSEHGHELTPAEADRVRRADMLVYVGLGLEAKLQRLVERRPVKGREVVCFADAVGIKDDHAHHDHEGHDHERHGTIDPHLWLDARLVEQLVEPMRAAIERALVAQGQFTDVERAALAARAQALTARVRELDADLVRQLAPLKGRTIVTHHNAWSRLADRFGLKVAAVIREVEGSEPTPDAIERAVRAVKEASGGVGGAAIFVEPQFNRAAGERIAQATGERLGTLDPLGDGDWFALMRANADSLVRALGP
ncbi:MAG: metal ABC transporter substrate-binding protein [Phycisphaerales bacterium]